MADAAGHAIGRGLEIHGSRLPAAPPADRKPSGFVIAKYDGSRYWMVIDPEGKLVCVTVYKRGAVEVVRRLAA
jgi:hypothetical protein